MDLLSEAETLLRAAEEAGIGAALVGGLAVRAHLGISHRQTFDIDLAMASAADVDSFSRLVAARGYQVLSDPWWRRAMRGDSEDRVVVDWTGPEIVDPTTLRRFRLGPERVRRVLLSGEVPVVGLADLLALKLLAGRDQDVADLACLLRDDPEGEARAVWNRAQGAGVAESLREEARRLHFAMHLGQAQEAAARVLGRPLAAGEVERLSRFVDTLGGEDRR